MSSSFKSATNSSKVIISFGIDQMQPEIDFFTESLWTNTKFGLYVLFRIIYPKMSSV